MTERELRKLNRLELLELLVAQGKDLEECQAKVTAQEKEIKDLQTALQKADAERAAAEEAPEQAEAASAAVQTETPKKVLVYSGTEPGNLAEAALQVSNIFEAAQDAAEQCLTNLKRMNEEQETLAAEKIAGIQEEADRLLTETKLRCSALEQVTKDRCREKLQEAEEGAKQYWEEVSAKVEDFYRAHNGLKELLAFFRSDGGNEKGPKTEEEEALYQKFLAEYKDEAK